MSITEKARKLAWSFLTMDDLLLAQSLIGGGLRQMGRVGFSTSGPSVALNLASRTLCLGAQMATRAAKVPLHGDAENLAEKMNAHAREIGIQCSTLAVQGIELAGGRQPQNPITKEIWLNKRATAGYTPGELAADTVFGTLRSLTMVPIAMGRDTLSLSGRWGATARVQKAVDAALNTLPGGTRQADGVGVREGLAALALEFGFPLAETAATLTDAAARLAFSDTRALREELKRGVARARLLAEEQQTPDNSRLRNSARKVAGNPPKEFMAALERGPQGEAPNPVAILKALLKDWRALSVFSTRYPQMMGMLEADLMMALVGGATGNKRSKAAQPEDRRGIAATFAVLDSLVGSAITEEDETPLFSRATVFLAQDLSFLTHRAKVGREAALTRSELLFGERVRERIAADVSLNADFMAKGGRPLAANLRAFIRGIEDGEVLTRQIDLCAERLALLQFTETSSRLTMTHSLTERIDALRLFTSLASCDLAMRQTPAAGVDPQARQAFIAWASEQS